jgi:hypothetical protein
MTTLTLATKLAPMHVISIMATYACMRNLKPIAHLLFMAGITIQFVVAPIELEFGSLVVLEIPCRPRPCIVT